MDGWMDASFGVDFAFSNPVQPRWMFPSFSGRRVNAPTDGVDRAAAILSCFLNAGSFNGSVGLNSRGVRFVYRKIIACARLID
jgi:hypothetical protein